MKEIYLDNNATTHTLPEVQEAVLDAMGRGFGNASSAHAAGDRARRQLDVARDCLAGLLGAEGDQLIFTSGGTEANNNVLFSLLLESNGPRRLITSTVEHSSILKAAEWLEEKGVQVTYLPVDSKGQISPRNLEEALGQAANLVSIQWVNNETGVIQPVEEFARICCEKGVPLHSDAAQAVGKIPINLFDSGIGFLSLTAHKLHGPQGVGALYSRNPRQLSPLLRGGPQERKLRAGTENISGIAGLGAAAKLRSQNLEQTIEQLSGLRDDFEKRLQEAVPNTLVNGNESSRVCNSTNIQFEGIDGQALVVRLDQAGIRCSQSSACTNQRPEPSYVLRAMGLTEEQAYSSVRFSFSVENTHEEIDRTVTEIAALCALLGPVSSSTMAAHS